MSSAWQPSLLGGDEVAFDAGFSGLERISLDADSWIDFQPEWVSGSDRLFHEIVETEAWAQRSRKMYDREVVEPRLTSSWKLASGAPLRPPVLEKMRGALSERYAVEFDSVGFNLYRDGRDSVAWHRDRIGKDIDRPIVVLVSFGERRRFLMRPRSGGASTTFMLGNGDLFVTGGMAQRTWDHAVPKVASAGPRISVAFRHGTRSIAYTKVEPAAP